MCAELVSQHQYTNFVIIIIRCTLFFQSSCLAIPFILNALALLIMVDFDKLDRSIKSPHCTAIIKYMYSDTSKHYIYMNISSTEVQVFQTCDKLLQSVHWTKAINWNVFLIAGPRYTSNNGRAQSYITINSSGINNWVSCPRHSYSNTNWQHMYKVSFIYFCIKQWYADVKPLGVTIFLIILFPAN